MNNCYVYHAYSKGSKPCLEIEKVEYVEISGTFVYVDGDKIKHYYGVIYANDVSHALEIIKSSFGNQYV